MNSVPFQGKLVNITLIQVYAPSTEEAKFACYSQYLLTSYFCILIHYDEKDMSFWYKF